MIWFNQGRSLICVNCEKTSITPWTVRWTGWTWKSQNVEKRKVQVCLNLKPHKEIGNGQNHDDREVFLRNVGHQHFETLKSFTAFLAVFQALSHKECNLFRKAVARKAGVLPFVHQIMLYKLCGRRTTAIFPTFLWNPGQCFGCLPYSRLRTAFKQVQRINQ